MTGTLFFFFSSYILGRCHELDMFLLNNHVLATLREYNGNVITK
jgi:hypothetical protein